MISRTKPSHRLAGSSPPLQRRMTSVNANARLTAALMKAPLNKLHCRTDFSAMMDFVPIRKVNCHVNTHGVLCIWCFNFKKVVRLSSGEEIVLMHSHDWIVLGSAEGKGKRNDWVASNAIKEYITDCYRKEEPQLDEQDTVTDGCRAQVSEIKSNQVLSAHNFFSAHFDFWKRGLPRVQKSR